jgi:hypothetical protein
LAKRLSSSATHFCFRFRLRRSLTSPGKLRLNNLMHQGHIEDKIRQDALANFFIL